MLAVYKKASSLNLSLDLNPQTSDESKEICGILTCKESIKETNPNQTEETISGMSIFKNIETGSDKGIQDILVAFLTSQQPHLTRVSDGVKVYGRLEAGQASIRVELTKQKDCEAQYTCEAKKLDSQRKESINSCQVLQRQVQDSNQEHDELKKTAEGSLPVLILLQQLDTKLALLDSKVGSVENRLEDKISLLHEDIENKKESQMTDKSVENIINTIAGLKSHFDTNLATLIMRVDSGHKGTVATIARLDGVFNSTITTMTSVHDLLTELQASSQDDHHHFDNLTEAVKEICNSNCGLTDDLNKSFNVLQTEFKTHFEQFQSDVNNLTIEILHSIDNKFSYTNATLTNSLRSINNELSPKSCRKGMTPAPSLGSFPYPVIVPNTESTISFPYLCDMMTDEGGWIIIQRRTTGNVDFYRDWATYKKGFGSLDDDFWLGNDNIHTITSSGTYELRVDLKYQGRSAFAHYSKFSIDGESNNYALRLGDYDGTAGDSFDHHRGRPFSTFDKDNDAHRNNCAKNYLGAWWYGQCHNSNLNGKWMAPDDTGPRWRILSDRNHVSYSEMKIRKL
ncbi:tenascin-r [Plakobranchus ocellatus]|uniref:Tenascin-r n=1 Tax=Plakobranchus ocellatus TaxID=259542 RepID=A0AAV4APA1_9GAST|nr:tenascin-r [Plakobranchus ocellatus]